MLIDQLHIEKNEFKKIIAGCLKDNIPISEMYTGGVYFLSNYNPNSYLINIEECILNYKPKYIFIVLNQSNIHILKKDQDINNIKKIKDELDTPIYFINIDFYREVIKEQYGVCNSKIIGITGSSGKTSTCFLLYTLLKEFYNKKVFMASSCGIGSDKLEKNQLSSIPFADIYNYLYKNKDCEIIIVELTSHGIKQERIFGMELDIALFISLQDDHLDYHLTMDDYITTKLNILKILKNNGHFITHENVLNNEYFLNFLKEKNIYFNEKEKLNIELFNKNKDFFDNFTKGKTINYKLLFDKSLNNFKDKYNQYQINNIEFALETIKNLGLDINNKEIYKYIKFPEGRYYTIINEKLNSIVVVDGAHNPDQIKNIIELYQNKYNDKNLIILYGIAGHRIKGDMRNAEIIDKSLRENDLFFIVDDNPQHIDSKFIRDDIFKICNNKNNIKNYENRFIAIQDSIKYTNSCILILGKSTEISNSINFELPLINYKDFLNKKNSYLRFVSKINLLINDQLYCDIEKNNIKNLIQDILINLGFNNEKNLLFINKNIDKDYNISLNISLKSQKEKIISLSIKYNEIEFLNTNL